ncbi:MAG: hypothetical protein N2246_03825, partial [Candidatus Sumerlaeia bacterium]|nr:hypothetical protein [Candidatus Sumerlaeia bacterium]
SIRDNAKLFNWKQVDETFKDFAEFVKNPDQSVGIYGLERIGNLLDTSQPENFFSDLANAITTSLQVLQKMPVMGAIVIDSLNVIPRGAVSFVRVFFDLKFILGSVAAPWCPYFLIVVFDAPLYSDELRFWEYASDISIRLGYSGEKAPKYNTFQIIKARYQPVESGEHHFVVDTHYPKSVIDARYFEAGPRPEGGTFIFPSIHWYLSKSHAEQFPVSKVRRAIPINGNKDIAGINTIIGGGNFAGIPEGGCTALVGRRGAQKSHLANYFLLQNLQEKKRCLLITLRDDESGAIRTLEEIARQEGFTDLKFDTDPNKRSSVFAQDLLEVMYFWPGYLTPQQFLHRVFLSLERGQSGDQKTGFDLVVLNGIDQLAARFPLCAKEKMFLPSLLTVFRRKGITTIVVAAEEEQVESPQAALLPLSDLVLRFDMYKVNAQNYLKLVKKFEEAKKKTSLPSPVEMSGWQTAEVDSRITGEMRCFVVEAMRVHWGQVGARRALIERARINGKDRMRIIPLPVDFPLGERVLL